MCHSSGAAVGARHHPWRLQRAGSYQQMEESVCRSGAYSTSPPPPEITKITFPIPVHHASFYSALFLPLVLPFWYIQGRVRRSFRLEAK